VPAWLHPAAETFVEMEGRAAAADHNARRGDMHGPGLLVAGIVEAIELEQEALPGSDLARRAGHMGGHDRP
jgi:hypothetical protein